MMLVHWCNKLNNPGIFCWFWIYISILATKDNWPETFVRPGVTNFLTDECYNTLHNQRLHELLLSFRLLELLRQLQQGYIATADTTFWLWSISCLMLSSCELDQNDRFGFFLMAYSVTLWTDWMNSPVLCANSVYYCISGMSHCN